MNINESSNSVAKTLDSIGTQHITIERRGGECLKHVVIIYSLLFWLSGIALITVGILMVADPQRNYVLDIVNFSEGDPLMRGSAYLCIGTGAFSLAVGFIGCCGALNRMKCLIVGFILCLTVLFIADIAIGTLALSFRSQFNQAAMQVYLTNLTQNRYSRDKWVQPLMDRIQFYHKCCGGIGPKDYQHSFWYITNNDRGTRSYVPLSCCKQTLTARFWAIQPIDPLCSIYHYDSQPFNSSVYNQGCADFMLDWMNKQSTIFAGVGFGFAALMMIGWILSLLLCNQIHYYTYIGDY